MVPFSVDLTKIPGAMSRGFCLLPMQTRVARRERSITSDVLQAMYYKRCIADCRAHCIQWPVIVSGLTGVPVGASQTPNERS